ncbi:hypothetical protein ACO1O0_003223 [Amphichorda felina]
MSGKPTTGALGGNTSKTCEAPQVSNEDLLAFFQAHFSDAAVVQFGGDFLNPGNATEAHQGDAVDGEWDEDDLGYYEDGVKRTLTDEQIEIFRHSELRELRRQREKEAASSKNKVVVEIAMDGHRDSGATTLPSSFKSSKKRKKKGASRPKTEPKPDLRKRTWDVVDKGLDTLDYD